MHPTWTAAAKAARPRPLAVLGVLGVCAASAGWCLLCASAYASALRPEPSFASRSVLVRPKPEDFLAQADAHVLTAVNVLQERNRPVDDRLNAYAREVALARDLYAASLQGRSYQPLTIARLAALRFEEHPPLDDEAWGDWSTTLEFAGSMAPRHALVQAELGELLVRMGRPEEALAAYARAMRLDPRNAVRTVGALTTFGVSPEEAVAALPRSPSLLLALQSAYAREERLSDYADLLEPEVPDASPELLTAWTDARFNAGQADRVLARLTSLGPFRPAEREASRCIELSRAALALADTGAALHWAEQARKATPGGARALEQSGAAALAAADNDEAVRFSREALVALAQEGGTPGWRARIYEIAGRAEEARGRMEAAHDAYSHALALDPTRMTSRERLEAMRAAAGLAVPSQSP